MSQVIDARRDLVNGYNVSTFLPASDCTDPSRKREPKREAIERIEESVQKNDSHGFD